VAGFVQPDADVHIPSGSPRGLPGRVAGFPRQAAVHLFPMDDFFAGGTHRRLDFEHSVDRVFPGCTPIAVNVGWGALDPLDASRCPDEGEENPD